MDGSVGAENASTNGHGRSHDNNEEVRIGLGSYLVFLLIYNYHNLSSFQQGHGSVPDKSSALKKRQCVLVELVSTEESYVQDLNDIVNG